MNDHWLTEDQQRIWRSYLQVEALLPARLGRELQAASGLSLPEYAVLVMLSETPDGVLRPFELGQMLTWEQSRLSHQLTRMENRGFVRREQCASDKRGAFVVITPAGREAIESAAPGHADTVQRFVFERLTPEQAEVFGQACATIAGALEE